MWEERDMKQTMRYISVIALLMTSIMAWADDRVVIVAPSNGTVTVDNANPTGAATVTLTVTPTAGQYYITAADIKVEKTVGSAQTRTDGPAIAETLTVTEGTVDDTGKGTYTFDLPDGYGAKVTATFTECATFTPTISITGWIYGSVANSSTVSGNTSGGTETVTYSVKDANSYSATVPSAAGNYTVKVSIASKGHYKAAEATADFTIAKKDITISGIQAKNKEWDGTTAVTFDYTNVVYAGIETGDALTVTATGTFSDADLGTGKTVTITALTLGGTSVDNYKLATSGQQETTNADIVQAVLKAETLNSKITLSTTAIPYTGNPLAPTVTIDGMTEGTDYTVKYKKGSEAATATKPTDYGTYTIVIVGMGNYTGEVVTNKTFLIDKAAATLTTPPTVKTGLVYNGTLQELLETAGSCEGGTLQYSTDGTNYKAALPKEKAAKTYTVSYKVVGDENHSNSDVATLTVTIAQKEVTVSGIKANNKEWDGTTAATFDYSAVKFAGIESGDALTVTATGAFADAEIGEGKTVTITALTLGGTSAVNYNLAAEGQQKTATADIIQPKVAFFRDGEGNSWGVEVITDANGNPTNEVIVTTLPASVLSGEDEVPATLTGSDGKTYKIKEIKASAFASMSDAVVIFLPEGVNVSTPVTNVVNGDNTCPKLVLTNVKHFEAKRTFTVSEVEFKRSAIADHPFTICLPYDFVIRTDITAYTLAGENAGYAEFQEIDGSTLRAYRPYLLKAKLSAGTRAATGAVDFSKGSVTIEETGKDLDRPVGNLDFFGTVKGLTNAEGLDLKAYVLDDNGMWSISASTDAADATKQYLKAFNAYLTRLDSQSPSSIGTNTDNATGIHGIHTTDEDGTERWYDLSGRPVSQPSQKGIYIKNGQKILVR